MFALMVTMLVALGLTVLYDLYQVVEGKHTHTIEPIERACGVIQWGIFFGFVLYALLHWI